MSKIADLTAITDTASGDELPIVDVSDTSQSTDGSTRKITRNNLLGTASKADLSACTNFEETISATTSEVTVPTGKTLNMTDSGSLKLAGTAITSTASELNFLDGSQSGTAVASKGVVLDGSKDIDGMGNINLDNNKAVQMDESGGTSRDVLKLDGSNVLNLGNSNIATIDAQGDLILQNDKAYQIDEAGGTARDVVTVTTGDVCELGNTNLTENAVNTRAKCRVYLSGDQTVSNITEEILELDTETYDIGGDWNTTNHDFTAPVTGYYLIILQQQYKSALVDAKKIESRIKVNGSVVAHDFVQTGNTASTSGRCMTIEKVVAGQLIEFATYHNFGGDEVIQSASEYTYGCIHLLSVGD